MNFIQPNLERFNISGHAIVATGDGDLPKVLVTTPWSTAEIYLHGAHVTGFQKCDEPPLLFLSAASQFAADQAIRGGVPICFPWFGARAGHPAHGFARLAAWELTGTAVLPDGSVCVRFHLPKNAGGADYFPGAVEYIVTVNEMLTLELHVTNPTDAPLDFENCLHTYFTVGDINEVSLTGLKGGEYLDKVAGGERKIEFADAIRFRSEVDRVYLDATGAVEIRDAKLRRVIRVHKGGSASTVVWNPWAAKSQAMVDFGDDEFHRMVCVEAGNVGPNKITLAPGGSAVLKVMLSCQPS